MSPPALPPGLYGMIDTAFGAPEAIARDLLAAGCRVMQLRAKGASTAARTSMARALVPLLDAAGALLIVNDDLVAARDAGAHGLHLGQDDGSLAEARAVLGPGALLGRSTHDLAQLAAVADEADYVGFGPVFGTATKDTGYGARGLALLAAACAAAPVPVVAIGGIDAARLPALRAAGARHWAVISDILGTGQPGADRVARARRFCFHGTAPEAGAPATTRF